MNALNKGARRNQTLDDSDVLVVKAIMDKNSNYYLGEIAFVFGIQTSIFIHHSTIRRCFVDRPGYSMKALQTIVKQQCEMNKIRCLQAMEIYLQSDAERMITIDETHKDRNTVRRRRGWGYKGNDGGVTTRAWFGNIARYMLITVTDMNGFIPAACHNVVRNKISDEGAAGTVDGEYFLYWVKEHICPVLESYELGEPRSVVLIDNISTYMSDEIRMEITATGAILIYGAPFCPHLNMIEYYFSQYKSY